MDSSNQKQSIIDRIKQANNILVTVSKNPSIDQLAAAIGLTLGLNKLGKHTIAVFSGEAPSTIEFLKPEQTFEKNTDSLRDFIISLDKAKADKLRYKVEDQMVKIFITPYHTSLSDKDLVFSQGDFNVEVVVALGVREQQDLDDAITAQGRILHDATVIDINNGGEAKLGTLIWTNSKSSSLCEMIFSLVEQMKPGILDVQMSTAMLTGIVAETERFSNQKTTPQAMQASSKLMAAGANQQLVATELAPPAPLEPLPEPEVELPAPVEEVPESEEIAVLPAEESKEEPKPEEKLNLDGSLEISHPEDHRFDTTEESTDAEEEEKEQEVSQILIDDQGQISAESDEPTKPPSQVSTRGLTLQPPTLGGRLTANTESEKLEPSIDIIGSGATSSGPTLSHQSSISKPAQEAPQTLAKLEEAVNSPHLYAARRAVNQSGASEPNSGVINPSVASAPTVPNPLVIDSNLSSSETAPPVIDPVEPPLEPPPMMPPNFVPPSNDKTNSL